jgi:EmrB/QacA subfamily drug resistance transporter
MSSEAEQAATPKEAATPREYAFESIEHDLEVLPSRRWWALSVIAIAQLMVVLDATVVNIALPTAQKALHISDVDRQWAITAYTLAFGGLLLLGGRIADYVGRKRIFIVGLIGFAAASALGGAAQSGAMLFGARALQGAFAALLAPAALSLITVTFTETKERSKAFAVYGAISGGGAAIGLILGGVLTEYASWRWCLLINVPIAIFAAVAAVPLVTESKTHRGTSYDIPGAVLITAGLVSLVYGFTEAAKQNVGWSGSSAVICLVAAAVLIAAFVVVELRTANPLLPLRVVLDRNRGGTFLASLMVGAGLFAMFLFLTYFLQLNLGYSALKSGFAFLPFSAGIIVTAGITSGLLPKVGPKPLMVLGLILAPLGLWTFTRISDHSTWLTGVLPGEILMSVGLALVFIPLSSLALTGVADDDAGVASAVLNATQQIGGSLGLALLSTFYASSVTSYVRGHGFHPKAGINPPFDPVAAISGYHTAFWIGVSLLLAALVAIVTLVNAKKDAIVNLPEGAPVG